MSEVLSISTALHDLCFIHSLIIGIAGELIEPQYETDYSSNKDGKYVIFNKDFILRTPFKQLPKGLYKNVSKLN